MISIKRATEADARAMVQIGNISVEEAHREACPAQDLKDYLGKNYNEDAITREITDPANIYLLISYNDVPAGFSKIIMNAKHSNMAKENVAKLDRIYLLKEFFNLKLGYELLMQNISLAKKHGQSGIYLYTWIGNSRAINFYGKAGFRIIGTHHFYVSETYYNHNHHMFLDLTG